MWHLGVGLVLNAGLESVHDALATQRRDAEAFHHTRYPISAAAPVPTRTVITLQPQEAKLTKAMSSTCPTVDAAAGACRLSVCWNFR